MAGAVWLIDDAVGVHRHEVDRPSLPVERPGGLHDGRMLDRAHDEVAGLVAGAAVLWTTAAGQGFFAFAQESAAETRKVVWPSRNETLQATAIVFVFVLIMALFMWVVDGILLWIVKKLIGGE